MAHNVFQESDLCRSVHSNENLVSIRENRQLKGTEIGRLPQCRRYSVGICTGIRNEIYVLKILEQQSAKVKLISSRHGLT